MFFTVSVWSRSRLEPPFIVWSRSRPNLVRLPVPPKKVTAPQHCFCTDTDFAGFPAGRIPLSDFSKIYRSFWISNYFLYPFTDSKLLFGVNYRYICALFTYRDSTQSSECSTINNSTVAFPRITKFLAYVNKDLPENAKSKCIFPPRYPDFSIIWDTTWLRL